MIWSDNSTGHPRIGLIVPKHRSTAVARNRLRRRLREICRVELLGRLPAWDVVVRARPEGYRCGFAELRVELEQWRVAVVAGGRGA